MSEWKPIETWYAANPRPERFLINNPGGKSVKVKMCNGHGINPCGQLAMQGYTILDDRGNPTKATHWMELPEPPLQNGE